MYYDLLYRILWTGGRTVSVREGEGYGIRIWTGQTRTGFPWASYYVIMGRLLLKYLCQKEKTLKNIFIKGWILL